MKKNVYGISHEINNQIANIHITETNQTGSETFVIKYVCMKQFDWEMTENTLHIMIPTTRVTPHAKHSIYVSVRTDWPSYLKYLI